MTTLREKITFVLTTLAYLLFHLRLGANLSEIAIGTLSQMLLTAPYAIGFAYIIAAVFRRLSGRGWPPWDRLLRLFFTFGILFAFFFALYEHAGQRSPLEMEERQGPAASVSRFFEGVLPRGQ
ncbi:MAG: hypothetical protein RBT36_02415 [Desulfobulbus sp.]|jgi:hypothetical protein|nr:hypothetical protein [Desulfobulbus sp.]